MEEKPWAETKNRNIILKDGAREIIPLVSDTHRRSDFIAWLQKLDAKYPKHDTIRYIGQEQVAKM